jgi:tetratricopeptide (TPR) repeat protein
MFAGILLVILASPLDEPLPATANESHKDALARYGAGLWQARRERLLTAAKSLEVAAKQDPDSTAALKELVSVYARIGREPEAIRAARTIMEKNPTDADMAHKLSRLLADVGEVADAVSFAKVAAEHIDLTEWPEKALAIYRDLASLEDRNGNAKGSVRAWQQTLALLAGRRKSLIALAAFTPHELDVETADAYERLGKSLVKAGSAEQATTAFQSAHKLYSDPAKLNDKQAAARLDWNLSSAFAGTNPAAALKHLEAFLQLKPQAAEPFERLVELYRAAGRDAEVVAALEGYLSGDSLNVFLRAVLALEQTRDPVTRKAGDDTFTALLGVQKESKILRLALRSCVETDRPARAIDLLDSAYAVLKADEVKPSAARTLAADKARALLEILFAEKEWAAAVLRAGEDDLKAGRTRTHQTWYALASLAARHKKLDNAAVQYKQAIQTAPPNAQADAYTQLINVLRRNHKPVEIADVCRKGLQNTMLFPAFFNYHLALALADLGEADEAIATADKAIVQAGAADRLTMRAQKVYVLQRLEKWDDATALCKKLLGEFDESADRLRIRYLLATSHWGAKRYAESEAELRAILDADPDHTGACNDLGYHLAEQGRSLDEAERLIRRAIAIDRVDRRRSGDPEAESASYLDSLAWVLFRREKLTEARDLLVKASAMPDAANSGVVFDHLGDVQFRLGEKERARAAWKEAEKLLEADSRGKRDGRLDDVRRKLKRFP